MKTDNRKISALILISIFIVTAAVYFIDPRKYFISIPCALNYFTGLYCPACGGLRATYCLMHFDFIDAFKYNLLIFFFLGGFLYYFIREIIFIIRGSYIPHINKRILIVFLIITIAYGIVRNLPFEPFRHFFALPF